MELLTTRTWPTDSLGERRRPNLRNFLTSLVDLEERHAGSSMHLSLSQKIRLEASALVAQALQTLRRCDCAAL